MNATKQTHTRGPWMASYHEPGNDVQHGLAGYSIRSVSEGIAYNVSREANARLLAAAPALQDVVERFAQLSEGRPIAAQKTPDQWSNDIRAARAALALANGTA